MFPIVTGTRLWARNPVHVRWESPVTGCAAATKAASLFADERVALLRRVDETCGRDRAGEVPRVDDRPVAHEIGGIGILGAAVFPTEGVIKHVIDRIFDLPPLV